MAGPKDSLLKMLTVNFILLAMQPLLPCKAQAAISSQERSALIDLYNSTNGPNWTNKTGWLGAAGTECSWYGVTCDMDSTVIGLALDGNQLNGAITSTLGNLANLQVLDLRQNLLSGSIPPQIGNLENLVSLYLENNQLSGNIPTSMGNLANLKQLILNDNQLSGSVPSSLGNLLNLEILWLNSNQLSGNIPSSMGNMMKLQQLLLSGNQLSGSIPNELGNLANLQALGLSSCQLSGSIPSTLGNLNKLGALYLFSNQLSGSIPPQLGNLTNLSNLTLHSNRLSGSIPPEIGNLVNLWILYLDANQLSGSIPVQLKNLQQLYSNDLHIGYNSLYATDPSLVSFLNSKQPGWQSTQTVAPTNVSASGQSSTSILATWNPITYMGDAGRYQAYLSTTSGGPYALAGSTTTKSASALLLSGLPSATRYYLIVRTVTDPNAYNQNTVVSEYSPEIPVTMPVAVTIATNPSGRSYSVDGTVYSISNMFFWTIGSTHTLSVTTPQSGGSGTRYTFTGWSDGGAASHTITVTSQSTYVASFQTEYALTTTASPSDEGIVTANPTSADTYYPSDAMVQLTAVPNQGFVFTGWSGFLTGTANPQTVTMNAPHSTIALFQPATAAITIATSPSGRSYSVDGTTYSIPNMFSWTIGSTHTISVSTPQSGGSNTCYTFTGWSDGGAATHTITVTAQTTYVASFQTQYQLTMSASPLDGGSVTANPASGDGYYASSAVVQLTAVPSQGFVFSGWSGFLTGTTNPQTVTMNAPHSTIALFQPVYRELTLSPGGASRSSTPGSTSSMVQSGYAKLIVKSGSTPYGTAVFSYKQNGITVSETGVPASPPTNHARVFIDYRFDVTAVPGRIDSGTVDINTGIGLVNCGSNAAGITYTLLNTSGSAIAAGHGTLAAGSHLATFIDQFITIAPDFVLPSSFQFATLDIVSDQPLSVMSLRMTMNQRNEPLFTTTPVADMNQAFTFDPIYFPQLADGGGLTTSLVLLNTSSSVEHGTIQIFDDSGLPFVVRPVGGSAASSFEYTIAPGGAFRFQTEEASEVQKAGWVRVTPAYLNSAPIGSGVFGYNPSDVLLTESGVPAAFSTTHARIYVDLTQGHNTGLAIANLNSADASFAIQAYQADGITLAGTSPGLSLSAFGHTGQFATQFITGLPPDFTGVLDISCPTPFAALTLRSLTNERGDFLMTTFPIADMNQPAPAPIVFPHIADGGGYITQFILLSPGGGASTALILYDTSGAPIRP
jgi:Leucine-rich repeat (LRR) protein